MRFQADAHISVEMVAMIRGDGHDCADGATIPPRLPDVDVLRRAAAAADRIVITADKDFGELVFAHQIHCPGVVLIRVTLPDEPARVARVQTAWATVLSRLPGSFVTVTDWGVRARPVP